MAKLEKNPELKPGALVTASLVSDIIDTAIDAQQSAREAKNSAQSAADAAGKAVDQKLEKLQQKADEAESSARSAKTFAEEAQKAAEKGGVTTVNVANAAKSVINFSDDPQTQITQNANNILQKLNRDELHSLGIAENQEGDVQLYDQNNGIRMIGIGEARNIPVSGKVIHIGAPESGGFARPAAIEIMADQVYKDDGSRLLSTSDVASKSANGSTLPFTAGGAYTELAAKANKSDVEKIFSLPIGSIFQAIRSDLPAGCVRLDGTVYNLTNYPDLYTIFSSGKIKATYSASFPTISDSNRGTIYYNSTQFKAPQLPAGVVTANTQAGLNFTDIGSYSKGALPNIQGSFNAYSNAAGNAGTGAFVPNNVSLEGVGGSGADRLVKNNFDASLYNAIYGTSSTVIPAHIKYPYFLVVSNSVPEKSETAWNDFVGNLTNKMNSDFSNIATNCDGVINIERKASVGSGNNSYTNAWKRTWKSGRVEVGFELPLITATDANITFTLPFPMPADTYLAFMTRTPSTFLQAAVNSCDTTVWTKTTTTIGLRRYNSSNYGPASILLIYQP